VPRSPTVVLVRDELVGFAKSRVMLVLWIIVPLIAIGAYMLLPSELTGGGFDGKQKLSAFQFMSVLMGSLSGLFAGIIPAADIVGEKNRNVYVLFAVRPFPRSVLLWAKFIAVCGCITMTCVVGFALAIIVDATRGHAVTADLLYEASKAIVQMIELIAMSCALGIVFGVLARSVLVAVLLYIFAGRNLLVIPLLPVYLDLMPGTFWPIMGVSTLVTLGLMWLSIWMFRKAQL
jgi:ABC-2 type transport system permease protein